jgi:peroxiredoxin Q/BCP
MLEENQLAPNFTLVDNTEKSHSLVDVRGKPVVVYFYPKDDTPGCTREACDFRDNLAVLTKENCLVWGISKDNTSSHAKFIDKYDLNFTLLSDTDLKVHKAYGALEDNKTVRSTFLIDQNGKLAKIWPTVKVDGHVSAVMVAVKALNG